MSLAERDTGLDLWLRDQVGHEVGPGDLSKMDALAVTAKIKAYASVTCILIAAAHERKAHKALGYSSWEEYVGTEFDMSKSRSYQLISQASFVLALAEETSTIVDVSEWEVRELNPVADEAIAAAKEAADEVEDPDEKERRIREALAGVRRQQHANHQAEQERNAAARQTTTHTTTETTTVEFDPATGEIVEGGDEPGAGEVVPDKSATPPPSPPPPKNPTALHMADLSAHRANVAKWMAFDRHDEVVERMTGEQREDYRSFVLSVFNHANATLDLIDGSARLKAVQ